MKNQAVKAFAQSAQGRLARLLHTARAMALTAVTVRNAAEHLHDDISRAASPDERALLEKLAETADPKTANALRRLLSVTDESNVALLKQMAQSCEDIARQTVETREDASEIQTLAEQDQLTKALNRKALETRSEAILDTAQRHGAPLSMLLLDIDHFKKVNDTYGHNGGDAVLADFARVLMHNLSKNDMLVRWGGEEFMILLKGIDAKGALAVAERLRKAVEAIPARKAVGDKPATPAITTSIGMSVYKPGDTLEGWVARADDALYQAKQAGRNRVVSAEPQTTQPAVRAKRTARTGLHQ